MRAGLLASTTGNFLMFHGALGFFLAIFQLPQLIVLLAGITVQPVTRRVHLVWPCIPNSGNSAAVPYKLIRLTPLFRLQYFICRLQRLSKPCSLRYPCLAFSFSPPLLDSRVVRTRSCPMTVIFELGLDDINSRVWHRNRASHTSRHQLS